MTLQAPELRPEDTHSYLFDFFALVVPLFWACWSQYLVLAKVAQLATTTYAT